MIFYGTEKDAVKLKFGSIGLWFGVNLLAAHRTHLDIKVEVFSLYDASAGVNSLSIHL